jgi:hypothetical protein
VLRVNIVRTQSQSILANVGPDIEALIKAIIGAANANAVAAQAAAQQPPPAPVSFALLPGQAYTAPLDNNKPNELKIFVQLQQG